MLDGGSINVPTMNKRAELAYAGGDGYQAVRLPYRGDAFMLVMAPDRGRFREFEQSLDAESL